MWALVTASGAYVLASIGPTYGAVCGWIEREKRRGLSILRDGFAIRPVTLAHDPTRDEEAPRANINELRRVGR